MRTLIAMCLLFLACATYPTAPDKQPVNGPPPDTEHTMKQDTLR